MGAYELANPPAIPFMGVGSGGKPIRASLAEEERLLARAVATRSEGGVVCTGDVLGDVLWNGVELMAVFTVTFCGVTTAANGAGAVSLRADEALVQMGSRMAGVFRGINLGPAPMGSRMAGVFEESTLDWRRSLGRGSIGSCREWRLCDREHDRLVPQAQQLLERDLSVPLVGNQLVFAVGTRQ